MTSYWECDKCHYRGTSATVLDLLGLWAESGNEPILFKHSLNGCGGWWILTVDIRDDTTSNIIFNSTTVSGWTVSQGNLYGSLTGTSFTYNAQSIKLFGTP